MALLYALSIALLVACRAAGSARQSGSPSPLVLARCFRAMSSSSIGWRATSLFAAAFALAALLDGEGRRDATYGRSAALGLALALLVLVRPVGQILVVLLPAVLLLPGRWRIRYWPNRGSSPRHGSCLLLGWATHNAVRAQRFRRSCAAAGPRRAAVPCLASSRIVDRRQRRSVARAWRMLSPDDLLPCASRTVRTASVHGRRFFYVAQRPHARGPGRALGSHLGLGRRLRAPRAQSAVRPCSRTPERSPEALHATPGGCSGGRCSSRSERTRRGRDSGLAGDGARLPVPTEGQPIPARAYRASSRLPDGRFREVWTRRPSTRSCRRRPGDSAHLDRINRRVAGAVRARSSDRDGNDGAAAHGSTGRRAGSRGRCCGSRSGSVAVGIAPAAGNGDAGPYSRPRRCSWSLGTSLGSAGGQRSTRRRSRRFRAACVSGLVAPRRGTTTGTRRPGSMRSPAEDVIACYRLGGTTLSVGISSCSDRARSLRDPTEAARLASLRASRLVPRRTPRPDPSVSRPALPAQPGTGTRRRSASASRLLRRRMSRDTARCRVAALQPVVGSPWASPNTTAV